MSNRILGSELQVGDTIEVWWAPNRDTITGLRPYTGPLAELAGARIASFALNRTGMTVCSDDMLTRVSSQGGAL